jgi:hypothetical protein
MVTDRGGLRYPIEVVDRFSANIRRFRDEIAAAKRELRQFQQTAGRGVGGAGARGGGGRGGRGGRGGGGDAARELTVEERARERLAKRIRNNQELIAEENLARKQGLDITNRNLEAITNEQRARRALEREIQKQRQELDKENLARKEGIQTARQLREEQARQRAEAARAAREQRQAAIQARALAREEQARLKQQVRLDAERAKFRQDVSRAQAREQAELIRGLNEQGTRLRRQGELEQIIEGNRRRAAEAREKAAQAAQTQTVAARGATFRLRDELQRTESTANRISFTFRRLFGILAAFAAARAATASFGALVRAGFAFNDQLERSRIGLAGIISSAAQVRDVQGEIVTGAEAYTIALGEASKQQKQLQRDALLTTATYEELLRAFQIATGPGLGAGLNLNQIRQFSVLISQAASAIDLPQNQLSEEIRALLTANIRPTTTRIAQVLSITNEDVRRAREAGTLFEFLRSRLEGFSLAAEDAARTLSGSFTRIRGAFELIAGEAAQGSFGTLRTILNDIFDTLLVIERDASGAITSVAPSPQVVAAFRAVFDAIDRVLQRGREAAQTIGFEGVTDAATLFAAVLETVGTLLVNIGTGIVRGFGTLQRILSPIVGAFRELGSLIDRTFGAGTSGELLRSVTQVLTVVLGIQIAFGGVTAIVTRLLGIYPRLLGLLASTLLRVNNIVEATKIWVAETRAGQAAFAVLRSGAFLTSVAFVGLVALTKAWLENILDAKLELGDVAEVLGSAVENVSAKLIASSRTFLTTLKVRTQQAFNTIATEVGIGLRKVQNAFDFNLGGDEALAQLKANELANEAANERAKTTALNSALELQILERKKEQEQVEKDADKRQADRINKVRDEANLRQQLAEQIAAQTAGLDLPTTSTAGPQGSLEARPLPVQPEEVTQLAQQRAEVELARAQLELQQKIGTIEAARVPRAQAAVLTARAQKQALEEQLRIAKEQSEIEQQRFRQENQLDLSGANGPERQAFAAERLNTLRDRQAVTEAEIANQIARQNEELRRAELVANGSLSKGLQEGAFQFAEQFSSQFEAGLELARGALNQFASFVADTIVDAFDPTQDFDIQERFARFLQGIARQVIETLTRLAVAKAILGLGLTGAAEGGEIGATGLARGGPVPRRSRAERARTHAQARGYAGGGRIGHSYKRPAGLDPRDTTPIWAQPGEFMMKLDAVRKYGTGIMHAINEGLIDPTSLKSLAGTGGMSRRRRSARIGYVDGGEIQQAAAGAQAVADAVGGGQQQQGQTVVQPVLVADDASVSRLLTGGRRGFLDAVRDNSSEIEGILRRNRRNGS